MKLLEPMDVGGMRLPNRIAVPAMVTRLCGTDGFVNDAIVDRYVRYAEGEIGLIVVEATAVHGAKSGPLLRLGSDEFIEGHRRLTDSVHAASASRVVVQIIHFLKVARSGWRQTIDSLSTADIQRIVDQFGAAAARARDAGYDGVELHSAHAYTLASFLSRRNPRTDEYRGRTLEGRLRLFGEVLAKVCEHVGDDFPVGVRFLADEFIKDGSTVEDAKQTALRMAQLGIDYISLSVGGKFEDAVHRPGEPLYPYTGFSGDRCMPDTRYPALTHTDLVTEIREHVRARGFGVPFMTVGKISDPADAERLLVEDRADLIGMARQLLADPDWPRKLREERTDEIVRCIYCNVCKQLDEHFETVRCFLWPKGELHAPPASEGDAPAWPPGGAALAAETRSDEIVLTWSAIGGSGDSSASGARRATGYAIHRMDARGRVRIVTAVKGRRYVDRETLGGETYTYFVRGYDAQGRSSGPSNAVTVAPAESDLAPTKPASPGGGAPNAALDESSHGSTTLD